MLQATNLFGLRPDQPVAFKTPVNFVSDTGITGGVVLVTPELASEWLDHNKLNRKVRPAHVENMAGAVARGEWMVTGEPIIFDADGVLRDGQHRLTSILLGNKAVYVYVIFGVSPQAFWAMNTGVRRSASDIFGIAGEQDRSQLASATNLLWQIVKFGTINTQNPTPTPVQLRELLEANPGLRDHVTYGPRLRRATSFPPSLATALRYYVTTVSDSQEKAHRFFELLVTGVENGNSPVVTVRNAAVAEGMYHTHRGQELNHKLAILTVKGYNNYRHGKSLSGTAWSATQSIPQPV